MKIRVGKITIADECGKTWWRWRSWVKYKYPATKYLPATTGYRGPKFRKLQHTRGFAFGPMMFWKE